MTAKKLLQHEVFKILKKRSSFWLLIATTIGLPTMVKVFSHLQSLEKNSVEGLFAEQVAAFTLFMASSFLFIPIWITVFVGQELSGGFVNRFAFQFSKKSYFVSKLIYCLVVSTYFSALALITLTISVNTSIFPDLALDSIFALKFFMQGLVCFTLYTVLGFSLVLAVRNPIVSLVLTFFIPQLEEIAFLLVRWLANIELGWLPFRMIKSIYTNVLQRDLDYQNLLFENPWQLIPPIVTTGVIFYLSYRWFLNRDLKVLSD